MYRVMTMNKDLLISIVEDATEKLKADLKTVIESDVNNEYSFRTTSNVVDGSNEIKLEVTDGCGNRVWSMEVDNSKIKIQDKSC